MKFKEYRNMKVYQQRGISTSQAYFCYNAEWELAEKVWVRYETIDHCEMYER